MTYNFGFIYFKNFSLNYRYGSWFVFVDGFLKGSFTCFDEQKVTLLFDKLKSFGLSDEDIVLCSFTVRNFTKSKRLLLVLRNKLNNGDYHKLILKQCRLLKYLIEMGYPKAVFHLYNCVENNEKISCKDTRETSAHICVPVNKSCLKCKWGKRYGEKKSIL